MQYRRSRDADILGWSVAETTYPQNKGACLTIGPRSLMIGDQGSDLEMRMMNWQIQDEIV
jgi:hypothetical protein